jgi:uncharacterized protein (DUF1800 family)
LTQEEKMGSDKRRLIAHLMRRAGFGATSDDLDVLDGLDYDRIVDDLIDPPDASWMGDHLVRRFHHEQSGMISGFAPGEYWLYRMVTTKAPLVEKATLFWHSIFATGYPKVVHGKVLSSQIDMFRRNGLGKLDDLLVELSKDPAMIVWLDNEYNHNGAINENYGRELLELFSMGVGNYSEDDIKEAARAFTGWTIGNTEYMVLRSDRDSDWPYGRIAWHFEFKEEDHDNGEKTFLGETGNFNGDDIVEIVCRQEATARFISRHMYSFFVADEPPVPQWPHVKPRDPAAIQKLVDAYFASNHSIKEMMRTLFKSDFFKSSQVRYKRVKSPAELAAGVLRLSGHLDRPRRDMVVHGMKVQYMGQWLQNPPSVEGWHQGEEWVETGNLVERVNFASEQLGDTNMPGIASMVSRIVDQSVSKDELLERCLEELGELELAEDTSDSLKEALSGGPVDGDKATEVLRLIAATRDFQRC